MASQIKTSFEITLDAKDWFFNKAEVLRRVGERRNKALLVAGAFISRKAKDLIRSGKKSAAPGKPPKKHKKGSPNLETILFALDPATDSMIVGPIKFNSRGLRKSDRETVPEILEFGGTAEITEHQPEGETKWMPWSDLAKPKYAGKKVRSRRRQATYAPHPFMSMALEKALPEIPEQFRDLI